MNYLPYEDFEVRTTMESREIFYRLRSSVETKKTWWLPILFIKKPYYGKVGRNKFRIARVTYWNRKFSPPISGEIQPEDSGSCIRIKMRLPWFSFFFSTIWLGAVWYGFFGGISNLIILKIQTGIWQIESPWLLLPFVVMFAFGYLLSVGSFKVETDRSKEFFIKLLQTDLGHIRYKDKIFGFTEFQIINFLLLVTGVVAILAIVINLF